MEQLRNNSVFQGTSLQKEGQFLLGDPRNVKKADPQAGKGSQLYFWQLVKGLSRLNMGSSTRLLTKPTRPAHSGSPCKAYCTLIVKFSETYFIGSGKGSLDHHCQASWTDYLDLSRALEKDAIILPSLRNFQGRELLGQRTFVLP